MGSGTRTCTAGIDDNAYFTIDGIDTFSSGNSHQCPLDIALVCRGLKCGSGTCGAGGDCFNGACVCRLGWTTASCDVAFNSLLVAAELPLAPPAEKSSDDGTLWIIIGACIGGSLLVIAIGVGLFFAYTKNKAVPVHPKGTNAHSFGRPQQQVHPEPSGVQGDAEVQMQHRCRIHGPCVVHASSGACTCSHWHTKVVSWTPVCSLHVQPALPSSSPVDLAHHLA